MSRTFESEPAALETWLWQRFAEACARLQLELSDELEAELRRWAKRARQDRRHQRSPEVVAEAFEVLAERLAQEGPSSATGEHLAGGGELDRVLASSLGGRWHAIWEELHRADDLAAVVRPSISLENSKGGKSPQASSTAWGENWEGLFEPRGHGTVAMTADFEPPAAEAFAAPDPQVAAEAPPTPEVTPQTTPPAADPPRKAFARLEAPAAVVEGVELEVTVGLAEKAQPGVVGGALERPASSVGPYTLVVQLVAEGFTLRAGESSRRELPVTAEAPFPSTIFHLTAQADASAVEARLLQALFSVDGQTIGAAFRAIAVVASPEQLEGASAEPQEGVDLQVPTADSAPDLTVRVLRPSSTGKLHWTFETPHPGVSVPQEPIETNLGEDAKAFARQVVDQLDKLEGKAGLAQLLRGQGRSIAGAMPAELWPLLREVAAACVGCPSLLLLSEEPFVPWELATVESPLLDDSAPPYLAAQTQFGRWVLARPGPRLPPPREHRVEQVDVVWGVYTSRRLEQAEAEGQEIEALAARSPKPARHVEATLSAILAALGESERPAQLLHFAVHGLYDQTGFEDGFHLTDGTILPPPMVAGSDLRGHPFVFLNACQVGSSGSVLGQYGGMAASFLVAGASAVIAPLWSVKDTIAREIALEFYGRVQAGGEPAAVLREVRKRFRQAAGAGQSSTFLAYQFFGHPRFRLELEAFV